MATFHRRGPGTPLPDPPGDTTIRATRSRSRLPTLLALRAAVALLAVATLVAACGTGSDDPRAKIGQPAPAITATTFDGTKVDLADYRGRPVIVNFWASWCVPCREEFPLLAERLAELGAADDLAILGVLYKDEPEMAQRFLDDFGEAWPTLADPDGVIADAYRVVAPPQTYFIDKDGILQAIQIGQIDAEDFETQYAKIKP